MSPQAVCVQDGLESLALVEVAGVMPVVLPANEGVLLLRAKVSVLPALPAQGVGCVKKEASAVVPAGIFQ